jgi:hypothetical protein
MPWTAEDVLTLTLRNIEGGPLLQQRRPVPTESDPARTVLRATRDYRVTFAAEPGHSCDLCSPHRLARERGGVVSG